MERTWKAAYQSVHSQVSVISRDPITPVGLEPQALEKPRAKCIKEGDAVITFAIKVRNPVSLQCGPE